MGTECGDQSSLGRHCFKRHVEDEKNSKKRHPGLVSYIPRRNVVKKSWINATKWRNNYGARIAKEELEISTNPTRIGKKRPIRTHDLIATAKLQNLRRYANTYRHPSQ